MKAKMMAEHPTHYVMSDGAVQFKVPKFGLSEDMHAKIRGMADGGEVREDLERQKRQRSAPVARIEGARRAHARRLGAGHHGAHAARRLAAGWRRHRHERSRTRLPAEWREPAERDAPCSTAAPAGCRRAC
jgi:hypothetical protein